MITTEVLTKKKEELNGLVEKLGNTKIETKPLNEKTRMQLIEVMKGMNKYKGDKKALKNFLIHTRNELRNSNR